MTQWLAGMRITPARLDANTVVTQTVGVVPATGWTVSGFSGQKLNGVVTVRLTMMRTGATITETAAGSGNINDTDVGTLPVGWRPPENVNAIYANANDGEVRIASSGLMTVRSVSGSQGVISGNDIIYVARWIGGESN